MPRQGCTQGTVEKAEQSNCHVWTQVRHNQCHRYDSFEAIRTESGIVSDAEFSGHYCSIWLFYMHTYKRFLVFVFTKLGQLYTGNILKIPFCTFCYMYLEYSTKVVFLLGLASGHLMPSPLHD